MEFLTVKETADMLRVSAVTVRRYIASGKLPAFRVGRNIRIRRADAESLIEAAEAYADTHEGDETPFTNPDGDTTVTPREWLLKNDPLFWTLPGGAHEGEPEYIELRDALLAETRATYSGSGAENDTNEEGELPLSGIDPRFADKSVEWRLKNHPLMKMKGFIKDEGPDDYSINHDKYLTDAYADTHEK